MDSPTTFKHPQHIEELLEKRYYFSGDIYKKYYGKEGKEDWFQLCIRVAKEISKNNGQMEDVYFKVLYNREFLPNSPTLFGAGISGLCLSACFVVPIEDSIDGWAEAIRLGMKIQTAGGGCGFPLSKLRPAGFPVSGKRAKAAGPIEFMKCWNQVSHSFSQAVRNGANMGFLHVESPDIEEFIKCKDKDGDLSAFNISVGVTDKFMEAVKNDSMFELKWNGKVVKKIKAKKLWDDIMVHAHKTGEPGVIFFDKSQQTNLHPEEGYLYNNPCSEALIYEGSACNLGSINLLSCVDRNKFDFLKLKRLVMIGYEFLDDLIDVNTYPDEKIAEKVKKYRQIGLGHMGFADVCLRLGIRYGFPESLTLIDKISSIIKKTCDMMNEKLAKERGSYPACNPNKKLRNSMTTTVAPTGTISQIAGVSQGIEPIFSYEPYKRVIAGKDVILSEQFKHSDPNVNVSANELTVKEHVDVVAVAQKYVSMSISKTINLPNNATVEDVRKAYEYSYEMGIKGITVYRDGSRSSQVLSTSNTPTAEPKTPKERPNVLDGKTFKDKVGCGNLYTTINFDKTGIPFEIFIETAGGGCTSNVKGLSKLISLALRSGIDSKEIISAIKGIKCPSCLSKPGLKFLSCPDSVGRALDYVLSNKQKKETSEKSKIDFETCPECGKKVVMAAGCRSCVCGWSKCG